MRLYGRAANATPRTTRITCEACGAAPAPVLTADCAEGGVLLGFSRRASLRRRLDPYYAVKAGRPDLAGKMLCPTCYSEIMHVINR